MSNQSPELTTPLSTMTSAWARMTGSFFKSAAAANTAALSAFDPDEDDEEGNRLTLVESIRYVLETVDEDLRELHPGHGPSVDQNAHGHVELALCAATA